ncbi:MAG: hypothetical protein MUO35_03770, partial [Anaerolineales bacterium]|nr:hypothetical protein [Anaerolineales bacterium]
TFENVRDAIQWVIDKIKALIDWVNKIPSVGDMLGGAGDLLGKIPGFASGTLSSPGGLAWVGERGKELVNLPGGSRVYSNTESRQITKQTNVARQGGFTNYGSFHVHVDGGGGEDFMQQLERQLR